MDIKRSLSPEEFDRLFRIYSGRVLSYAHRHLGHLQDAQDVMSQVFLKIQEKWHTYDPERSAVSTWIYVITRNEVYDVLRRRTRRGEVTDIQSLDQFPAPSHTPEEMVSAEERLKELTMALERLPERERDILILRFYIGLSSRETALRMGLSDGNVRYLQMRALQKLRILME